MSRTGNDGTNKEEPMDEATEARQTGATYEYGSIAVQDANGTADGATGRESGIPWLDSAALAECRRLTAENAALRERNAELRAALDQQGDELARVRREAASGMDELDGGRLLIVADSIASDADGLRTIEAYGRFFVREDGDDGATVPDPYYWMRQPLDADGVPVCVNETVYDKRTGEPFKVSSIEWNDICWSAWSEQETRHICTDVTHSKPRTLEDVLSDFAAEVENGRNTIETARWYADEIRELTEVD